jgi:rod shape-determining protein MreD
MKKFFTYLILLILLIVFETKILPFIRIFGIVPDIILILVVFLGLSQGVVPGVTAGFFIGLLQDAFAVYPFGAGALAKTLAGFICGRWCKGIIDERNPYVQMIIVGVAGVVVYAIVALCSSIFSSYGASGFSGFNLLIYVLVNALIAPPLFFLFRKLPL